MDAAVTAGAGFLLAVLWFDLMFDVQVLGRRRAEPPAGAVASIAAYYRRVTTDAFPMNRLVGAVMLGTLAAVVAQLVRRDAPRWVSGLSLAAVVLPVGLAAFRTVPHAVRLGRGRDQLEQQRALARGVGRDHVLCFACIAALLAVQLVFA